jgi:type IV fimbrial biogenesis protein FimT
MKNQTPTSCGFTLIELIVTVAIAAILLGIAIPSFLALTRDTQTVSETSKLARDLTFTRSEAIRRGVPTSMCASNNGTGCAEVAWNTGWVIFSDTNADGAINGPDAIIQVNDGLGLGFTINTAGAIGANITYAATGAANATDTFRVCRPDANAALSRAVNISPTGRISVRTVAAEGLACP